MTKQDIIHEIQRTAKANGGVPLGWRRFQTQTGIAYHDWFVRFWTRWNDAIAEAGLTPNAMSKSYEDDFLLVKLVELTRKLQKLPVRGDILLAANTDPSFPSEKVFRRFGPKPELISRMVAFCEGKSKFDDVFALWKREVVPVVQSSDFVDDSVQADIGYVYLLQHGSRKEYKIGRTNNPVRREGEIGVQLPEKLQPIHYIKTDDPSGVENYWHSRFANKRKEGEWFALTSQDVSAFKRWKRIY